MISIPSTRSGHRVVKFLSARLTQVWATVLPCVLVFGCSMLPAGAQTLYAVSTEAQFLVVNTSTGQASVIGNLGITQPSIYVGMSFDGDSTLYLGESRKGNLYGVDTHTGQATYVRSISTAEGLILENMAFAPVPVPGSNGTVFPAGTLFGSKKWQPPRHQHPHGSDAVHRQHSPSHPLIVRPPSPAVLALTKGSSSVCRRSTDHQPGIDGLYSPVQKNLRQ